MKKRRTYRVLTSLLILSMVLSTSASATYTNGPSNSFYNRTNAAQYVYNYVNTPNPAYYDFSPRDCTSFASQVLAAGGMPMTQSVSNPTTNDWYYYGPNWGSQRTATWTDAHLFRQYWADVNNVGAKKAWAFTKCTAADFENDMKWLQIYKYLEPGDIIQYVRTSDWVTYHSQIVHRTSYENGEFKVSVGQHSDNLWRNLRNYVSTLSDNYVVCAIKIKQPSTSYRAALSSNEYSVNSISKLEEVDDTLFNSRPLSMEEEDEKWSRINSIKEELVKRANFKVKKTPVTKESLLEFINNRIENNNNVINSITRNTNISLMSKENNLLVENCKNENAVIASFLTGVLESDGQNIESINILWNEYWNDIVKQSPPSYYSCAN